VVKTKKEGIYGAGRMYHGVYRATHHPLALFVRIKDKVVLTIKWDFHYAKSDEVNCGTNQGNQTDKQKVRQCAIITTSKTFNIHFCPLIITESLLNQQYIKGLERLPTSIFAFK